MRSPFLVQFYRFCTSSNQMNHFYVDISAPSLHGNNSEIGAKTVNIKMSYRFIVYTV